MTNQVFSGFGSHRIILEFTSKLKTGTLVFYPGGRKLFFEKGALVFAGSEVPEEHFAEILVQSGVINKHQLTELRGTLGKGDSLGKALKNRGLASARQLAYALKQQISQIMVRVIDQAEGECQVLENILPEKLPKLKIHTLSLIIQSLIHAKNADEFANLPIEYTLVPNLQYRAIRDALSFPPVYQDFMRILDNNKPILSTDLGLELGYDVTIVDRLTYVLNLMGMISIRLRSVSPRPSEEDALSELQAADAPKRSAEELLPEAFPSKAKSEPMLDADPKLVDFGEDGARYGLNETITEDDTLPTLTSPLLFPPKPQQVEFGDTLPEQEPSNIVKEPAALAEDSIAPEDRETVPSGIDLFDRDTIPGANRPKPDPGPLPALPNFSSLAESTDLAEPSGDETVPGKTLNLEDEPSGERETERTERLKTQEVIMYEEEDESFSPFYDAPKPRRPWLMVAGVFLALAGVALSAYLFLRLREQGPGEAMANPAQERAGLSDSEDGSPPASESEPSQQMDTLDLATMAAGNPPESASPIVETEERQPGIAEAGAEPETDPDRIDTTANMIRPAPDDFKGHIALSKQHLQSSSRNFSVAFVVACQPETVIEVLANYTGDDVYLFPRSFQGKDCYLLTWGLFPGHDEAANARNRLPGFLKQQSNTPWVVNLSKYL